jgi:predicted phosphate transport protein (TIGR00153 family)
LQPTYRHARMIAPRARGPNAIRRDRGGSDRTAFPIAFNPVNRLTRLFIPQDRAFFPLFERAGANILRAATLLDDLLSDYPDRAELARDIVTCEHEGDQITHEIMSHLNRTFVTPIEREDIHELASALDDVVDLAEEVSDFLGLYKVEAPMAQAQELAHILRLCAAEIDAALPKLRSFNDLSKHVVEINRLENEGDRVYRSGVAALFDNGIDPMVVIRWRDIYLRLERAIDATERVANILDGIVIKNT